MMRVGSLSNELTRRKEKDEMATKISEKTSSLFDREMSEIDFSESNLFGGAEDDGKTASGAVTSSNLQSFLEGFDTEKRTSSKDVEMQESQNLLKGTDCQDDDSSDLSSYKAVLSNGKRISIRKKAPTIEPVKETSIDTDTSLYGVPIYELLQELEEQQEQQAMNVHKQKPEPKRTADILLSEKHRPKRWVDLMGTEKTHRQIMNWLMNWSKVVFDGDLTLKSTDKYGIDELGRPARKILLIHGPPGIGKTTVAHIIAKQAGYDILEINASDERSGKIIESKVSSAVESHRIGRNGSSKPVCIIADEIEGAAESGFIKSLNDLLTADQKACKSRLERGKKNNKSKLLLRPIIAICNDVYASSLRKLRPNAEIVHYSKSDSRMVVSRLKSICETENIVMTSKKLTEIAESAEGDLRMCLNIIQFGSDSFEKDKSSSWSKISNKMFRQPFTQMKIRNHWDERINDINTCGEYDKMLAGCFVLYPRVSYTDDLMRKPSLLGEWLDFSETMNSGIYQSQHGALNEYLSYAIAAFHQLFSSSTNLKDHRIESEFYEFSEKKRGTKELLKDVTSEFHPNLRQMFKKREILLELLPYSVEICSPLIESSISTLRTSEKNKIQNSADTLSSLGIQLIKERLESGPLVYRFDLPIERLTVINSQAQDSVAVGKYTVRQLIQDALMSKIRETRQKRKDFVQVDTQPVKRPKSEPMIVRSSLKEFIQRANTPEKKNISESPNDHERLWIQFVEGFSNAVRKDMSWKDFWSKE